ncbi:TetR family transcriptional regulator [uncultured Maricaulis sp.]|uniref:TetR/AcrR family transcriptional regulator n=1 Tax=uncultured Maricaulis sp. TaxID=174710 RepID=UPI0030DB00D3|tara:strand:+ start:1594 stop:2160 length:567 start_codon:yes stop_codon:yes gene_type:complete
MTKPARPRNAEATRAAILAAARHCLSRESYDQVGIRDIAVKAGVDAALVCRYFGSKEDLFAQLLRRPDKPLDVIKAGRDGLSVRVAEMVVSKDGDQEAVEDLLIMLRSASSKTAASLVRDAMVERFDEPIAQLLEGESPQLRARMMGSVIIGLIVSKIIRGSWDIEAPGHDAFQQRIEDLVRLSIQEF